MTLSPETNDQKESRKENDQCLVHGMRKSLLKGQYLGCDQYPQYLTMTTPRLKRYKVIQSLQPRFLKEPPPKIVYSYGIFLYCVPTRRCLLIQNRDSEAFRYFFILYHIEKYSFQDILHVLSQCTQNEIQRLLTLPFDELYRDVYINHDPIRFKQQEERARYNYTYFHHHTELKDGVRTMTGVPIPWEFPKGKKMTPLETPWRAACREFEEETCMGLTFDMMDLVEEEYMKPLMTFQKQKQFFYQTTCVELFGVSVDTEQDITYKTFPHIVRSRSVSDECLDARWVDLNEATALVSDDIAQCLKRISSDLDNEKITSFFPKASYVS